MRAIGGVSRQEVGRLAALQAASAHARSQTARQAAGQAAGTLGNSTWYGGGGSGTANPCGERFGDSKALHSVSTGAAAARNRVMAALVALHTRFALRRVFTHAQPAFTL